MENDNFDWKRMSDIAIAEQIAVYIKNTRLDQNKTQEELAVNAGVTRRTLTAFESGKKTINLITLIQLIRALGSFHLFDGFKIEHQLSPMQLAKLEHEKRKRASSSKQNINKNKSDW